MPFSGFCTMPWRMRNPIRVFISFGFVSIQLLARDCGVELGCAAKTLVGVYVCLFSKQLPHIFVIKLLKTYNTRFIIKVYIHSVYTEKFRSWTCHTVWYKRLCQIQHFFISHSLSCTILPVSDSLSESSSVLNENSSDSSENTHACCLCLKLLRYPRL